VDFPEKYEDYQVLTERWRLVKTDREELYEIKPDPGQKKDIANKHPETVKDLRQKYEDWWKNISGDFDRFDAVIIGSDKENPLTLYSHDAHDINGRKIWVIDVEKDGQYEFILSRWPEEADKRISENRKGNVDFQVDRAHLIIGNRSASEETTKDSKSDKLAVHLGAGMTCLEAWFSGNEDKRKLSADFVTVNRAGPPDPAELSKYQLSDPDRLLGSRNG
jgi:hypothetical protein